MRVTVAQMGVGREVAGNRERMLAVLARAQEGEWIAFPEGALSGYFPEESSYISALDADAIERAVCDLEDAVRRTRCRCVVGTAARIDGVWRNAVYVLTQADPRIVYCKRELSRLDSRHFTAGGDAHACTTGGLQLGIQVCRELLFPAAWMALKAQGAQVIFHVNNALKPHDAVWEHLVVARAVELGVFVCSVNNAAPPQALTSYLVSPSGEVLLRADRLRDQTLTADIDLSRVIRVLADRTDY